MSSSGTTGKLRALRMPKGADSALLAVASGVLAALAFPPREWWWLAPVALVPLLAGLRRARDARVAGCVALLFGLAFNLAALPWLPRPLGPALPGVLILMSLWWVVFGAAYRMLAGRAGTWGLFLMTPVLWLAADWIRCDGWYFRFSWLQLGLAWVPWQVGRSLYPLVGAYGVTFLIAALNGGMAGFVAPPSGRRRHFGPLAAALALAGALVLLALRVEPPVRDRGRQVSTAVVQDESGEVGVLRDLTRKAGRPGLIVWPEYAIPSFPLSEPETLAELRTVAREAGSVLILGCKEHAGADASCDWLRRRAMMLMEGQLFYNAALVLGPDGRVLGTYHKTHPIQFFADGVPGRKPGVISTPAGRLGLAICYDFDFASSALRLVRDGAELLVVPTFDARNWGHLQHLQHTRMAEVRAAEVGRHVARATSSGISQILGPDGVPVALVPDGGSGVACGPAYLRSSMTPYVRVGWLLPYLCVAASVLWALSVALPLALCRMRVTRLASAGLAVPGGERAERAHPDPLCRAKG